MALEEKISKHLGKPYIYLKDQKKFLCSNGVLFTLEEYKNGIDINAEYERRAKEDMLYDYAYAKSTGILRKKRTKSSTVVALEKTENVTKEKEDITGYGYEPWHYRYVGVEIAKYIQEHPMTYEEYFVRFLDNEKIDQ